MTKERFEKLGGVVSDVMNVLETTAREIPQVGSAPVSMTGRQVRQVRMVMLTASHALMQVLEALNDEAR
jgi:hypothetical protein